MLEGKVVPALSEHVVWVFFPWSGCSYSYPCSLHHCWLKCSCVSFELINKDSYSNGRGNRGLGWLPNRIGSCPDAEVCLEKPEKCRREKTVAGSGCVLIDTGRARPLQLGRRSTRVAGKKVFL